MSGKHVTLEVDGRELTVPEGTLIIRAAEILDVYIPRFCDHPYLAPLGACRQCLVEIEGQRKPLTACTTPVAQGMVVRTQHTSTMAANAQEGMLELLLINHPLDCPVCDKGGECPLQDQAHDYGPGGSRFIDAKRRYVKPVRISPLVLLDRERCVLCARCTRFAGEVSGDPFIELFERSGLEQVAIYEDEPYLSPFSGNVVQICPVGALTAETFRFRARPFDMTSTPSTCNLCASGCAQVLQERRGELVRVLAGDDAEVNEEWSCDKGRFAQSYVHRPDRVSEPLVRKGGEFVAVSWAEAIRTVAERLDAVRRDGGKVGVLGGGKLADEDAYALSRFARTVLGTNDVDARAWPASDEEDAVLIAALRSPGATYTDLDSSRVIVVAGLDPREESPILFLRLRKAAMRRGAAIFEVGARATPLARAGARSLACAPGTEAGVLMSAAWMLFHTFGAAAPEEAKAALSSPSRAALRDQSGVADDEVVALAEALSRAEGNVVVLAGERLAASPGALAAAWNLACALGGRFGWVPRRSGMRGALWAGLHPRLLPGGRRVDLASDRAAVEQRWGSETPAVPGRDARAILEGAASLGVLYLAGTDPAADFADATLGRRGIEAAPFVVAHDLFLTDSSRLADVVLPAAAVPEREGTLTDWEGRRRSFSPAVVPAGIARADWEIVAMVASALGSTAPSRLGDLRAEMAALERAPAALEPVGTPSVALRRLDEHYPMALVTYPLLLDSGTLLGGAEALGRTAEPVFVELHPEDAAARGIGAGDAVRVVSPCGHVTAPARLSRRLARRAVFVPARQDGLRSAALVDAGDRVTLVRVEKA